MATLVEEPADTGVGEAAATLASLSEVVPRAGDRVELDEVDAAATLASELEGAAGGASSPMRMSPPPGWLLADDGRYMPPPHLRNISPQATVVAAWAMHRQMSRLATDRVDAGGIAERRTRHGV